MRLTSGGILLIDKPRGWTSFDVVAKLRGVLGIRKIGHTGTLDPFADGLLAVCFGRATRLIQYMEAHDKTYRVTVAFGRTTDTLDLTGQTTAVNPLTETERADLLANGFAPVQRAVAALTGITAQVPPLYSAVKVNGRPLYRYARQGREVDRDSRPVRIDEAVLEHVELLEHVQAVVRISCSKGTYIRSLCETLGEATGWGAHAHALRRIGAGPWRDSQALEPGQLAERLAGCPDFYSRLARLESEHLLVSPADALPDWPILDLTSGQAEALVRGQPVLMPSDPGAQRCLLAWNGLLAAVARCTTQQADAWRIRTERVLIDLEDLHGG
ncbi:MAG: tRNA pseudouridine(55) synthase TruB [Clostridiaceae bacterium]|nr:tRNA pseudouridine(55) synthase TruB [Clostridiaceae bacterium]